jgi:phage terminase small subunit
MTETKPTKLSARQRKFAQELATGKSQVEAYEEAGYKPDRGHAARLAANGSVIEEVERIHAAAARRADIDLDFLILRADSIRLRALDEGELSVALAALKELGILTGLRVERRQEQVNHSGLVGVTTVDLVKRMRELEATIAARNAVPALPAPAEVN